MRHARFDVATLSIEGVEVLLKAAYLLIAEQDGADQLQWECLAYALDPAPIPNGGYVVEIVELGGRTFTGRAVLVRSVDGAHVLRGDGELVGASADDLG